MTDAQFKNSFTAAGGWFIVSQYRLIAESNLPSSELLDRLFAQGFDADLSGTKARLAATRRIIREDRVREAMEKIRDSVKINRVHPEAHDMAQEILDSL